MEAGLAPGAKDLKSKRKLRICCDMRKLNTVLEPTNSWPLPLLTDIIRDLYNVKYLSLMDLTSFYWQLATSKKTAELLAFSINGKLMQWNRLVMGATCSPRLAQAAIMSIIIKHDLQSICYAYIDNVIIIRKVNKLDYNKKRYKDQ